MTNILHFCNNILRITFFLLISQVTEWEHGIKASPVGGPCTFRMSNQAEQTEKAFVLCERDTLVSDGIQNHIPY